MRGLRHLTAIVVAHHLALILRSDLPAGEAFDIVAHVEYDLVGHKALFHQFEHELLRHLADDYPRLIERVRALEHLPRAETAAAGAVRLNVRDSARLIAPRMVYQQPRVHAEELIERVLIVLRAQGDIAHRVHPVRFELFCVAPADAPEIRQRPMLPELLPVALLRELRDAHTIRVRLDVLCDYVHRDLT